MVACLLDHPDWPAKRIAASVGVGEPTVSIALHQKLPLELMGRWSRADGGEFDDCLPGLVDQLRRWRQAGNVSLASRGLDLLLWGFAGQARSPGLDLVDARSDPYLLTLLELRSQIALAEQDLRRADETLGRMERLLRAPRVDRADVWRFRLHYILGRRHTAEFRYDLALREYDRVFRETPQTCWAGEPVFLHSLAVAHRGVGEYESAREFMVRAIECCAASGREVDATHTRSRLARVDVEDGAATGNATPLERAEEALATLAEEHPDFRLASPLGYVQYLLHRLRLDLVVRRRDWEAVKRLVEEINGLVNRGAYAHEFLELEELFVRHELQARFGDGLRIAYEPSRPRFGQKVLRGIRRRMAATHEA